MNPSIEQLRKSELYFIELEDALDHYYSDRFLPRRYYTLTVRADEEGKATPTLMSETRFPALDDLKEHCVNLVYSAQRLDSLPETYWRSIDPLYGNRPPFYIPMQIIEWGKMGERIPHMFRKEALGTALVLKEFPWRNSNHSFRDHAEQCVRMLRTYIGLREHFDNGGLPEGVVEF